MRLLLPALGCALLAPLVATPTAAQRPDSTVRRDPSNTLPLATTRTVRFTTDQGTWMSVDLSPDGSTILFDLLGDIYTVPANGGKATRLVGGTSVDGQPRYSPDGRSIVFLSDRSGVDATWVVDVDGRRPRLVAQGGHYPAFTPDGRQIITGNRLVDVRGGTGVVIPDFGSAPSFTADGRYVWFQVGTQAARFDREKGEVGHRTNLAGGVLRPLVSRDGKRLAYFTSFEGRTALVVRELATGAEQWITMATQPEAGTAAPVAAGRQGGGGRGGRGGGPPAATGVGPLPTSAWTPDGNAIVTSFGGRLWKIDLASGQRTAIPFTVDVEQALGPLVKHAQSITDSVVAREIREPSLSPDGKRVAFAAVGKIWVMELSDRKPRRVTRNSDLVETSPAWTLDGKSVVFATWSDAVGGDIFQVDLLGGAPRNLTRAPALYSRLAFTPDGSRLVFARAPRRARTVLVDESAPTQQAEVNLELRWMSSTGGPQHPITMVSDVGVFPAGTLAHFSADTSRVYFNNDAGLVSTRWDGSDRKIVLANASPHTMLAPDGVHVLSRIGRRRHIYLFEIPRVTDSLTIDPAANNPMVPSRRLTRAGGDFPTFSRDGATAVWSNGTTLYVYDIARGDKASLDSLASAGGRGGGGPPAQQDTTRRPGGAPPDSVMRWAPAFDATAYDVRIAMAADKPEGSIVLRGARIVSMRDAEVIENGDIVVTGNRIAAVGARGAVALPRGARTIDVGGKTIVPGFIDVHAQIGVPTQVHRTMVPQYLANLAFGVTTVRDPEAGETDVFTYADRVAFAELLGPRVFSTGPVVLDSVRTLAEGRTFFAPFIGSYRPGTIRSDLTATRADRQRFLMIGRELGVTAVLNGAADFRKSLGAMLDGFADHQTAYEIFPLHDDMAKLIAQAGVTYTPLLTGRVGNRNGYEFMLATESPHDDARVRRYYYHKDLDRLTRARGTWISPDEYPFEAIAAGAARIVSHGGRVALGTNGRMQGLGLHWEMWLLSRGGMSNHDILRAATTWGADVIGVGNALGSIEVGKLADLVVLDQNPLTNIRHSATVKYTMKNGRLYDAMSLEQIAPLKTKPVAPWWIALDATAGAR